MKIVSSRDMQGIDRRTIAGGHVAGLTLMENAGRAAARVVLQQLDTSRTAGVEILCGRGNNGGDGLVVARLLAAAGVRVRVHLSHPDDALSPDALANYRRLAGLPVPVEVLPDVGAPSSRPSDWPEFAWCLHDAALCIDALLGTGVTREVTGRLANLIGWMNLASRRTIALDLPSGIDGDTGEVHGIAVRAHTTVTFGLPKTGLAFHPGRGHAGEIVVADIGFPAAMIDSAPSDWEWFGASEAKAALPQIDPAAHKYSRGVLVIVGGSRTFPGAAMLAARAAQRTGAGLVHLVVPASICDVLNVQLPEVIVHGAAETPSGALAEMPPVLGSLLARAGAVVVGPGLGDDPATRGCVAAFLKALPLPAVVDAEAQMALPGPPHAGARILTPHAGELARWAGTPALPEVRDRSRQAARIAQDRQVVILSKGAPSVVLAAGKKPVVNASGNVGLATAGSGDVLAGILGSFLSQGTPPETAASLAAYLHGRAAEQLTRSSSSRSLVAGDLLGALGIVLQELE